MSKRFSSEDQKYMALALALAEKGRGRSLPNPMVGAVFVKEGQVIRKGYYRGFGRPHAEFEVLKNLSDERVRGGTLYVTLEPCISFPGKKNPSCAEMLALRKLKKVVVAMKDPNPKVHGKGIRFLKRSGVDVRLGLLKHEAARMNEVYEKNVGTSLPFVTLKLACSLDGKIATRTHDSRWITSVASRRFVHRLRADHDAVLTTSETVIRDDPGLGVRYGMGKDPFRVVLDRSLRTRKTAKVYRDAHVVVFTASEKKIPGVDILKTGPSFSLRTILQRLYRLGVRTVLVEAGGTLAASLLKQRLVDRVCYFVAPLFIGGDGLPSIQSLGVRSLDSALWLDDVQLHTLDRDIVVEGVLNYHS